MPAPLQLDTNQPDWRRQFRGITVCKGPTCGARIGWVIHIDDQGRERRVPYNNEDGRIHHSTCPDVETFKRQRSPQGEADAIENKVPQGGEIAKPPMSPPAPKYTELMAPPPKRTKPQQDSLFGVNLNPQTNYPD